MTDGNIPSSNIAYKDLLLQKIDEMNSHAQLTSKMAKQFGLLWYMCEIVVMLSTFLTPIIVVYRKSAFFPSQFWVWWCIIMPVISGLAHASVILFDLKDRKKNYNQKSQSFKKLANNTNIDLLDCSNDEAALHLYKNTIKNIDSIHITGTI